MITSRIRCPFKIELAGVSFQCERDLGHTFRCANDPPGCGGDATITWKPTNEDLMKEIQKVNPIGGTP
jgi:hypothetical protein